ncbi:MAG: hypothetical protein C0501_21620 [Isosphaera sp.]|nr:hypothetical protein [Isosphaera sp.]
MSRPGSSGLHVGDGRRSVYARGRVLDGPRPPCIIAGAPVPEPSGPHPVRETPVPVPLVRAVVAVLALPPLAAAAEPLSRAEVAKLAKPATALVEVKGAGFGSSFCVHPSGLFVTNEHVVSTLPPDGAVTLVLDPGLETQKTLKARVVRADKEADLALLRADGEHKLPALAVGSDEGLGELTELIAFGFPFGVALAKPGEYPTVTVNVVNVSSLRTDADRKLHRIQLDSTLNPGNSGGPVVDRHGKVMGVVVGGIRGAGINVAVPARHLARFLARPQLAFTPPVVSNNSRHELSVFQVDAAAVAPGGDLELELVLATPGAERRFPMAGHNGRYTVRAAPFPPPKADAGVRVEVRFPDGTVAAEAEDRAFKVGADTVKLGEVRTLRLGARAVAVLGTGKTVEGPLSDPGALTVLLGGRPVELKLAGAAEVRVVPAADQNRVGCTVIARAGGKEVGRLEQLVYVEGTVRATLEALRDGKFHKPLPAAAPATYLKSVSSKGDYIGQGKSYSYEGAELKVDGSAALVTVNVDGWNVQFAPPRGGALKVGEYDGAKRYPFNDDSPGLSYVGHGRGSNQVGGKFVVWELEVKDGKIAKLAIDFIYRSEITGPPLYGMLRYNSTLE